MGPSAIAPCARTGLRYGVPDRNQRGIFELLWGREGRLTPELLGDVLLMAVLADGRLTEREVDALSWAVAHRAELSGLEWEWLVNRAGELQEDAPLFSDLRARLASTVTDPKDRRVALTLANRVAGADGPLANEEEGLLRSLAEAFEIGEAEQLELLRPAPPGAPAFTWRRPQYADPSVEPISFFDALAQARDAGETRIMIHRLHAIRALWDTRFTGGTLKAIGFAVPAGSHHVRIDGVIEHQTQTIWVRTLATGESLYARERKLLPRVLSARAKDVQVLIAHSGPLSPADQALLAAHDALDVVALKL